MTSANLTGRRVLRLSALLQILSAAAAGATTHGYLFNIDK